MTGGRQRSRTELVNILEKAGFENKNNRVSHLLLSAELDGIICSGATRGKAYTYALLDERAPKAWDPSREEALARLAQTYFNSHGPATLEDFCWWSGLMITDARKALEMIEADFISEEIDSQTYWFPPSSRHDNTDETACLLPAYDEFLISYKDRSAVLADEHQKNAFSKNGIFWPVIVAGGQVIGTWKRSVKKERVHIETQFFSRQSKKIKNLTEDAAERFAQFLDKKPEIKHT